MELRVAGDLFSSLLMLCYCALHVLTHFVHWNWCIKAMCSESCVAILLCCANLVCADRSEMASPRLVEGYLSLFSSPVLLF